MFTRVFLSLGLLVAMPAPSQVNVNTPDTEPIKIDRIELPYQTPMLIPPPVNVEAYPTTVGSETRSHYLRNYLRAGLTIITGYSDNVIANVNAEPVSDVSYSIWPTIAIDRTTSRLHLTLNYRPGFTMYQRTGSRNNQQDQSVDLNIQYRLSPHVTVTLLDSLDKTSNALNQPDALPGGGLSGTAQPTPAAVVVPVSDQLRNVANAELTYQFANNRMIGAEGMFANLHYPKPAEVPGLYDFTSSTDSTFYSQRLSGKQYIGATYQYSQFVAFPVDAQSKAKTDTILDRKSVV